jgi:uncharacterized protein YbjT (DUF2867 family)
MNLHVIKLPAKYQIMNEQTAVVIGATGLIGNFVVEELLKDNSFTSVRVLVRRSLAMTHPKLQQEIVNFSDLSDYSEKFGNGDVIFCCIGTTQKKVKGDKQAYEKIDFDIPVHAASIGISKNFKKYLLVSAIGANEASSNFYLKLKGRTENALKQFPFQNISIFHPSILLGNRKEIRPGEKIMQRIMKAISFLLIGSLKKYRAIDASDVAKAMVNESKKDRPGIHIFDYAEMMDAI